MKALKWLLCLALCFGLLPEITFLHAAQSDTGQVIDVTDYGANPYSIDDTIQAVELALDAASQVDGPVTLLFPNGRYDFYPDQAPQRELYVSNTTGSDQSVKNKTIGILIENMNDLTIEGDGSLFMFHGKMTEMAVIDSENITFQNFTTDFQSPTVVDVTVESVNGNSAIAYIPECWEYSVQGTDIQICSDASPYSGQTYWTDTLRSFNYTQVYDIKTGLTIRASKDLMNNISSITDLGNHRVQINYSSRPAAVQAGKCFQMRQTLRDHPGAFFWKSKDVHLENLNIQFLHGFGMVGQHSENISLHGVRFEAPADSGRTTAGFADFLQMSGCKGLIDIQDCVFSNPHDDPINVHGTFNTVTEKIASNKIKVSYMHNETAGFPNYFVGDQIEFMTRGNMIPVENSIRTVVQVDGPDGTGGNMGEGSSLTTIVLTLDQDIPDEITVNNHVVENITWTPSVQIKNCLFKETPTRGILCTTRQPVLIESNVFDGMGMASIYISDDAQGWYESGPVRDMRITANTFKNCGAQAIFIEPTNPTLSTQHTVHSNIQIDNNTFILNGTRALDAKSVSNLTFENNTLLRANPFADLSLDVPALLDVNESAQAQFSVVQNTLSTAIFYLAGCQNVVFNSNVYDGNINTQVLRNSTDSDQVTISQDQASLQNNLSEATCQIRYESSDPSVLTVSDSGVLFARKEGTATVSATAQVGGRTWRSEEQLITVSGQSDQQIPTRLWLESEKDSVSVDEPLLIEAKTEGEHSGTIQWSVWDASTNGIAQNASMQDGVFTASKGGLYEVRALGAGGLEASLFVSVQESNLTLADELSIEFNDGQSVQATEDGLTITTRPTGLYQEQTPANVVVGNWPIESNCEIIVKATGKTADNAWGALGLYLYQDQDNYVSIERKQRGGTISRIAQVREMNRSAAERFDSASNIAASSVWLKLNRQDNSVTSSYSLDGTSWIDVGQADISYMSNTLHVALASLCGSGQNPQVTFSDLQINQTPVLLTRIGQAPSISDASLSLVDGKLHVDSSISASLTVGYEQKNENGSYSPLSGRYGNDLIPDHSLSNCTLRAVVICSDDNGTSSAIRSNDITLEEIDDSPLLLSNASLIKAEFSGAGAQWVFNESTKSYWATAGLNQREISWNLEAESSAELVLTLNGQSLSSQGSTTLMAGCNVFEARVLGQDGGTENTWRFVLFACADPRSELATLMLNDQPVPLIANQTDYAFELNAVSETLSIAAVPESDHARVWMFTAGGLIENNQLDLSADHRLYIGVQSETAKAPTIYSVDLILPEPADATVRSLSFEKGARLLEAFSDEASTIHAISTGKTAVLNLEAARAQTTLKISQNGKLLGQDQGSLQALLPIRKGENVFLIESVSEDGSQVRSISLLIEGNEQTWLSDLNWETASSGDADSPTRKDLSCQGNPLTLFDGENEIVFEKGIGSHAPSEIVYDLSSGEYDFFDAFVGVDRETGNKPDEADIIFIVKADGVEVYNSGVMTYTDTMKEIHLNIEGVQTLTLLMQPGAHNWSDHGDFANARLTTTLPDPIAEPAADFRLLQFAVDYALSLQELGALNQTNELIVQYFEACLAQGQAILSNPNASQQEVDQAWTELTRAIHMVDFKTNKTELLALVQQCEAIDLTLYKDGQNKDTFVSALENAKNVLDRLDVLTDQSIARAIEQLKQALLDLEQDRIEPDSFDLTVLTLLVLNVQDTDLSLYYENGVLAFQQALAHAKAVLDNPQSQSEIDQACITLHQAWLELRLLPDESLLAIVQAFKQQLDQTLLSRQSFRAIQTWHGDASNLLSQNEPDALQVERLANQVPELMSLLTSLQADSSANDKSLANSVHQASVNTASNQHGMLLTFATGAALLALLSLKKRKF